MSEESKSAFTGRGRKMNTKWTVRFGDIASRLIITIGGIGTIAAVSLVGLFLVYETLPLFMSGEVAKTAGAENPWEGNRPIRVGVDEYNLLGYVVLEDGDVSVFELATGTAVQNVQMLPEGHPRVTSYSFLNNKDEIAFGFENGTVRLGEIGFKTTFPPPETLPDDVRALTEDQTLIYNNGIVQVTPEGQFRKTALSVELQDPIQVGEKAEPGQAAEPIVRLDLKERSSGPIFVAMTASGRTTINAVSERRNMLTGKTTLTKTDGVVPFETPEGQPLLPEYLMLSGLGDKVYAIWDDGTLLRYDARNLNDIQLAETIDLLDDQDGDGDEETLNVVSFMLGNTTLLVADDDGDIIAWSPNKPETATTRDGILLQKLHTIETKAPVTAIGVSPITRTIITGQEDGGVSVYFVTSEKEIAYVKTQNGVASEAETDVDIDQVAISPKEDGFLAINDLRYFAYTLDPGHPETNIKSLFGQVWYEGYAEPDFVWQSTGGTDEFEPKLSLIPLIFGTLKATIYSMLFGTPIALLAAIYTSEFLHPRVKAKLKPTIELMASLPSVVLGFLAGLVIAPFVEDLVPALIGLGFTVPVAVLLGAYLWQMLPGPFTLRFHHYRLIGILVALLVGITAAWIVGPALEAILFAGNIKLWLDGQIGSGLGGWMMLFMPLSAVAVAVIYSRVVNPALRSMSMKQGWSRSGFAIVDLIKFGIGIVATIAVAALIGGLLTAMGIDPRGDRMGDFVGTYIQRNALIVGFAMGFAIIPIIYTIAEDALSTVPEHLRSASLGSGATPWQTAVRIIIPTAMSGLFSACMIGLGRAVGETMIVLMAAGNTPIMQLNIFNGFRTLSANLATEMPEAVKGSTHYRTLILAALVLFIMTFMLNTVAEAVRQRFRKRSAQL